MFKDFISESGITRFTTLIRTNFPDFKKEEVCRKDQRSLLNENKEFKEIISSCNSIIYVDNPPINISVPDDESEREKEMREEQIRANKGARKESRKRALKHLTENCLEIYKLKEWDSIHKMVDDYMKRKEQIEKINSSAKGKELEKAKNELIEKVDKTIKGSIGLSIPGLPIEVKAEAEYTTHIESPVKNN